MAWFEHAYTFDTRHLKLAHFTDCHLFANKEGEYFSVNTANYLAATLRQYSVATLPKIILLSHISCFPNYLNTVI